MHKKIIRDYLLIAFVLAYAVWGVVIIAQTLGWFQYGTPISLLLIIIGANAPAISAYIVIKKSNTNFSLKKYFKTAFALKQKPRNYFILLLFVAVFFIVPALTGGILTDRPPFMGGTESQASIPLYAAILASPLFFFVGGSEELGWRYLLQPEFEKQFGYGLASILTGFIWAVWHLPLFFITGSAQSSTQFLPFTISIIGLAFASAAIYYVSKSAWLAILFHCLTNALQGTWAISPSLLTNICTSVTLIATSLIVVQISKKYFTSSR